MGVSAKIRSDRQARAEVLVAALSKRQLQVLQFLVDGLSSKEMARAMGTSYRTVEIHRNVLFGKLGVRSSLAAASVGAYAGLGVCEYLADCEPLPATDLV